MADYTVSSEAMAMILARIPKKGYAQTVADILVTTRKNGNSKVHIVKFAKQGGYGQSAARLRGTAQGFAQAQTQTEQ